MTSKTSSSSARLVRRGALLAAFAFGLFAVLFNKNPLVVIAKHLQMSAAQAQTSSAPAALGADAASNVLLMAVIVVLVLISVTGRKNRPLPRSDRGSQK